MIEILIWIFSIISIITILYVLICWYFSRVLLYPHRQPIIANPEDYDMKYEDINFKSQDGVNLKGWFMKGTSNRLIVMTHPATFNRHGFIAKNQGFMKVTKLNVDYLKPLKPYITRDILF